MGCVIYLICIPNRLTQIHPFYSYDEFIFTPVHVILIMHDHEATEPPPFAGYMSIYSTCCLYVQYMYRDMNMENESVDLCYAHAQYGISLVHRVQFCSCTSVFLSARNKYLVV